MLHSSIALKRLLWSLFNCADYKKSESLLIENENPLDFFRNYLPSR